MAAAKRLGPRQNTKIPPAIGRGISYQAAAGRALRRVLPFISDPENEKQGAPLLPPVLLLIAD